MTLREDVELHEAAAAELEDIAERYPAAAIDAFEELCARLVRHPLIAPRHPIEVAAKRGLRRATLRKYGLVVVYRRIPPAQRPPTILVVSIMGGGLPLAHGIDR